MRTPLRFTMSARDYVNVAVLAATILPALVWLAVSSEQSIAEMPVRSIIGAALLYLTAHTLRAIRLALLTVRLVGISGRTTALLHFVTAPGALTLPFKAGELLRLYQLWHVTDNLAAAVLVVLSERFFDGLVVLCLLAIAMQTGANLDEGGRILSAATASGVILALIVLLLGPGTMTALQLHVIRYHSDRITLQSLGQIDLLRRQTTEARKLFKERGGIITLLSLAIWMIEVAAASIITVTARTESSWLDGSLAGVHLAVGGIFLGPVGDSGNGALGTWMMATVAILVLVWPIALWRYLGRVPFVPRHLKSIRYDRIRDDAVDSRSTR